MDFDNLCTVELYFTCLCFTWNLFLRETVKIKMDFFLVFKARIFLLLDYVTPTEIFQVGDREKNYMDLIYHNFYIV